MTREKWTETPDGRFAYNGRNTCLTADQVHAVLLDFYHNVSDRKIRSRHKIKAGVLKDIRCKFNDLRQEYWDD